MESEVNVEEKSKNSIKTATEPQLPSLEKKGSKDDGEELKHGSSEDGENIQKENSVNSEPQLPSLEKKGSKDDGEELKHGSSEDVENIQKENSVNSETNEKVPETLPIEIKESLSSEKENLSEAQSNEADTVQISTASNEAIELCAKSLPIAKEILPEAQEGEAGIEQSSPPPNGTSEISIEIKPNETEKLSEDNQNDTNEASDMPTETEKLADDQQNDDSESAQNSLAPEKKYTPPVGIVQSETENLPEAHANETDMDQNCLAPHESSETSAEATSNETEKDPEAQATRIEQSVKVKEEPCGEEIDYGMPIAKTPMHKSTAENYIPLENASKSALDEYLDGMETPIAPPLPRLRVKTELALLKPPQPRPAQENNINKDDEAMETEECLPPPPPVFSSNSSSELVADGIATPRISLASINRLRVKSEFAMPPPTPEYNEEIPSEDFFNDLIDVKNIEREAGEVSPNATDEGSEHDVIPNDYFDDLLIDKLKEKIQQTQNEDLEVKYSDRLKELERLKNELRRAQEKKERKKLKKQKKAKKKSKKRSRSRSRSLSPYSRSKDRNYDDFSSPSGYDRNKRRRMSPLRREQSLDTNHTLRKQGENFSRVDSGFIRIKTEFPAQEMDNFSIEPPREEEIEEVLTPKQRKEKAVQRATSLLNYLKSKPDDNTAWLTEFPFVSTVRKLPPSHSYVHQQIYENRSPLHTVNNVSYKINSHTSRFNMEEWGLASLSPVAAKMAKLVGCNAQYIHDKLKTMKIPAKLRKIKQEPNAENGEEQEEELLVETTCSLFANAMTQTDDDKKVEGPKKGQGFEIGVQAKPEAYSIGCQTLETPSSKKDGHKSDELPIMSLIQNLNENQLMAMHAFAELIKEPNENPNSMEKYKIQMKIMEIYKMSQIPATLETAQPPIINNYAATSRPREQSELCIQSVKSADGRQFTVNDPRSKSAAYSKRGGYDEVVPSSSRYEERYDERYSHSARPPPTKGYSQTYFNTTSEMEDRYYQAAPISRHRPYHVPPHSSHTAPHSSQSSPPTVKHYGRGGLRR